MNLVLEHPREPVLLLEVSRMMLLAELVRLLRRDHRRAGIRIRVQEMAESKVNGM